MTIVAATTLREYADSYARMVTAMGAADQALPYRLLADYGVEAAWTPLPDGETFGLAKRCYSNATERVLFGAPGLTYYEGLVSTSTRIAIPHAWAADADGGVYEMTLRHNDPRCPYCDGAGTLHPTDEWDYEGPAADDDYTDDYTDLDAEVDCRMCGGTGSIVEIVESREGTTYLGISIADSDLREAILANERYGVLFEDPDRVARLLADR